MSYRTVRSRSIDLQKSSRPKLPFTFDPAFDLPFSIAILRLFVRRPRAIFCMPYRDSATFAAFSAFHCSRRRSQSPRSPEDSGSGDNALPGDGSE